MKGPLSSGMPTAMTDLSMLLVFCLLSVTAISRLDGSRERGLEVPRLASPGRPSNQGSVRTVGMDAAGTVHLDGRALAPEEAARALAPEGRARLAIDRRAGFGRVSELIDALSRAGVAMTYVVEDKSHVR